MAGGQRVLTWHDRKLIPDAACVALVMACIAITRPNFDGILIAVVALAGMPLCLNPNVDLKPRQLVVEKWWEFTRGQTSFTYAMDPRRSWLRRRYRGAWELAPDGIRLGGSWLYGEGQLVAAFQAGGYTVKDDRAESARVHPTRGRIVWLLPRLAFVASLLTLLSWVILGLSIAIWIAAGVSIACVVGHEIVTAEGDVTPPAGLGEEAPATPHHSPTPRRRSSRH